MCACSRSHPQHPPPQQHQHQLQHNSSGGSPMDIDYDSPFSPGSASDLSDLFEPPSASPPTSSLPKIARHHKVKKASDSKAWQSIIGETDKHNHNKKSGMKKIINSGITPVQCLPNKSAI